MASVNIVQGTTPVVKVTGSSVPSIKVTNPDVNVVKVVGGTISFESTTIPQAPSGGLEYQFLTSENDVAEWDYVQNIFVEVENGTAGPIAEGTPIYAIGLSGNRITVGIASANSSTSMPCIGILYQTLAVGAHGYAVTAGVYKKTISGLTGVSVGDTVYVGSSGGVVTTKPSHPDLIQNIGVVLKTTGSNIQKMKVSAIDRVNDVPNITQGKFLIGGSSYAEESAYTLPTSDGTQNHYLKTDGSGAVTFNQIAYSEISGVPTLPANNGELLIGGTSGVNISTLTAGTGITITNADGQITITSTVSEPGADTHLGSANLTLTADRTHDLDGNYLYFKDGADPILYLADGTNRVGVNTTSPDQALHVAGQIKIDDGSNPYTFPAADGSSSEILITDGSGTLSFTVNNTVGLADVSATAADTAGDVLIWDNSNTEWVANTITGGTNISITNADGSITINADTINSTNLGDVSATAADAAGEVLIWDNTNTEWVPNNLTAGSNITITNADGSVTIASTASGTDNTLNANITDVLSLSTQEINAVDATADKIVFWDDSAGKLTYATPGTNLTFSGTDLNASGGVDTSGTPADDQIAVFTDSDTIEGDSNFTWNGTNLTVVGAAIVNSVSITQGTSVSSAGDYGTGARLLTKFGTNTTVTAGKVYYVGSSGWAETDADASSTSSGLIGVATTSASRDGIVVDGIVKVSSNAGFTAANTGDLLYLHTTAGTLTSARPSGSGDIVRVAGYVKDATNSIVYFSPSKDFIELA